MNHSQQENLRVKDQIVNGLFSLLKVKSFSSIKITDLIQSAKVARASYYRNFDKIEDILIYYFQDLQRDRRYPLQGNPLQDKQDDLPGVQESFELIYAERERITLLLENGLSDYFYQLLSDRIISAAGDMPANSTERYRLYVVIGTVFSILSEWLLSGAKESPDEMAKVTLYYLKNGVLA
ncbi:TetR-like C-terminal domain-containing protein [Weissella paramesenteroides]|uniref:TetR-like C-terminal domain-containing protein n=1 Tax=Weissella paramesenteroides TaxID=1249 RepID=UPI002E7B6596|nr:TetR-like C-terminal domain-containing protein [Weissella paramesenteroides]WPQ68099.1 TetR-like C-terminal domain-containing protein [Weissella paramesenteroides]